MNQIKGVLSNKDIMKAAPSVFATEPWEGVSKRYTFIPTINVVDAMRDSGFVPVRAAQSRCRIAGKSEFTKHMLRFRHRDDAAKFGVIGGDAHHFYQKGKEPVIAEVIITNAHDRSAAYALDAGVFRLICSNGLVISSSNFGAVHVRHSGDVVKEVLDESLKIIARVPEIRTKMTLWQKLRLTSAQRLMMAEAALIQRYGLDDKSNLLSPIAPADLLAHRRAEDNGDSLWLTTNVIQENLMRGEISGLSANGRKVSTRKITSVNTELEINRGVWALADVFAEQVLTKQ
jgi:hypothetical protein